MESGKVVDMGVGQLTERMMVVLGCNTAKPNQKWKYEFGQIINCSSGDMLMQPDPNGVIRYQLSIKILSI